MTIRTAVSSDTPRITELWLELQCLNASHDLRLRPAGSAKSWFVDFVADNITSETAVMFVAESAGQIVGYVFGQIIHRPTLVANRCGYIADICVEEKYRGQGVGRRLYVQIVSWFHDRCVHSVEVQIVRASPASQAFWRKMGFGEFLRILRNDTCQQVEYKDDRVY